MHSKKCTTCGADNDPLFTNCKFCKNPLQTIDLNSLSNEELIQNAAEWIGKMGQSFTVHGKDFNQWTLKDYRRFDTNEIEGYAYRYLELLHVRATTNLDVQYSYDRLEKQFNAKKNNLLVKLGGGDKKKAPLFIYLIVVVVGVIWGIYFISTYKDANVVEVERLSKLEQQVIADLSQKKYDDATVILNGMEYSISWAGADDSIPVRSWRKKKYGYLQTIQQLKKNR